MVENRKIKNSYFNRILCISLKKMADFILRVIVFLNVF